MTIRTDRHVVIDLTQQEALLLKDMLTQAKTVIKEAGSVYERLWMDLLYGLPSENT